MADRWLGGGCVWVLVGWQAGRQARLRQSAFSIIIIISTTSTIATTTITDAAFITSIATKAFDKVVMKI